MAQQALATKQVSTPEISPSVKNAGELMRELAELEKRLTSHPAEQKEIKQYQAQLQKLIAEDKLDSKNAAPVLESLKGDLAELAKLKLSADTKGIIEQASSNLTYSKEIIIPISQLGLKREEVVFSYKKNYSDGSIGTSSFNLSANSVRSWQDNLMDASIVDRNGNLSLKVYSSFNGSIDFEIHGQKYHISQQNGILTSNISAPALLDNSKALGVLNQLSTNLPDAAKITREPSISILSEVKGINVMEVKPDTALYQTLKQAKEQGFDITLSKYDGTKTGEVQFEIRKDNKSIGVTVTLPRDFASTERDYFAERDFRLTETLKGVLEDQRKGLSLGASALEAKLENLSSVLNSEELKKALGELEYTNSKSQTGEQNRKAWQQALSTKSVREMLGFDGEKNLEFTPELLAKVNKRLDSIGKSAEVLLSWSRTNNQDQKAEYSGYDMNLERVVLSAKEPELKPSIRSEITRPLSNDPIVEGVRPELRVPDLSPNLGEPSISLPEVERKEMPFDVPELAMPPEMEPGIRRIAPFAPIIEPIESVTVSDEIKELIGKTIVTNQSLRINEETVRALGIEQNIIHPEFISLKDGQVLVHGINPDNLSPVYFVGTKGDMKLSDSRYDASSEKWFKLNAEKDVTPSDNQNARVLNGTIAGAILQKDSSTSVASAFMSEYYQGVQGINTFFSGNLQSLQTALHSRNVDLQYLASPNLVNVHFNEIVSEIAKTKDGVLRVPANSIPEPYSNLGDVCFCSRNVNGQAEVLIFKSQLDPNYMKTFVEKLKAEGWSANEAARKDLLAKVARE